MHVDDALRFRALGISLIRVPKGRKKPILAWAPWAERLPTEDEIRAWWGPNGDHNVALIMGAVSGLVAVDADSPEAEQWVRANLPPSNMGTLTSKGKHRFYRHPGVTVGNKVKIQTSDGKIACDVKGDHGYVMAPGSLHPEKGFIYRALGHWDAATIAALPVFDPAWIGAQKEESPAAPPPPRRNETEERKILRARAWLAVRDPAIEGSGGDNHTLSTASTVAIGFDLSDEDALSLLLEWDARCVPPWTEKGLRAKIRNARKYCHEVPGHMLDEPPRREAGAPEWTPTAEEPCPPTEEEVPAPEPPPEPQEEVQRNYTDLGNAERLLDTHGDRLRFCRALGGWMSWDGKHWQTDALDRVRRLASKTIRALENDVKRLAAIDEKRAAALATWQKRSESEMARRAMVASAEVIRDAPLAQEMCDRDPWLLNCVNGTLDLRTGTMRRHRREDYITKICPVAYDHCAPWPDWGRFLEEIMLGDSALIAFLQRAVGYSLSGSTREQVFFFLHGSGSNGKSTFLGTLMDTLGRDYATQANSELFVRKANEDHPTGLARLRGVRFLSCREMPGGRLDEELIKQMTGEDSIVARFLHKDFFEYQPAFKIWMAGNKKPEIRGADEAIWRRPLLVPFLAYFALDQRDKTLGDRLRAEGAGILNWAVQGALQYQEQGLAPPEGVRLATSAYREEQDILGPWIADRAAMVPGARSTNRDLYASYKAWCDEEGCDPLRQRTFSSRLAERGLRPFVSHGQRGWDGIALSCREVPSATRSAYREED